jgi:hypothetical protein
MVTPRTSKPRGAPPIAWRDDPDRYAVALIAALDAFEVTSVRQISLLTSGLGLGRFASETVIEKIFGPVESTVTFAGRADSLRKKYRAASDDPEAAKWLVEMGVIFMLLIAAKDWPKVIMESTRRAAVIGEEAFVHDLVVAIATSDRPKSDLFNS